MRRNEGNASGRTARVLDGDLVKLTPQSQEDALLRVSLRSIAGLNLHVEECVVTLAKHHGVVAEDPRFRLLVGAVFKSSVASSREHSPHSPEGKELLKELSGR